MINVIKGAVQTIILSTVVLFSAYVVIAAWSEPTVAPTGGNASAPLDVSATGQTKAGGLILNTGAATNGLIVSAGKVGIGTVSPGLLLDVYTTGTYDGARVKKMSDTAGAAPLLYFDRTKSATMPSTGDMLGWITFRGGAGATEDDAWIQSTVDAAAGGTVKSPANLTFSTSPASGSGVPVERMRITSTGNIGIGTTTPTSKLEVNGLIYSGLSGFKFPDGTIQTTAGGGSVNVPTRQVFLSGTAATYTRPTNPTPVQLRLRVCAGGGGGGGSYIGGSAGATGGTSSFNSITAIGGGGGILGHPTGSTWAGGAGGTGGAGSASFRFPGGAGWNGWDMGQTVPGLGNGGGSAFFGGGAQRDATATVNTVGYAGVTNSGGGGSGGRGTGVSSSGGGGGECYELIINSPGATYTYTVGAGGAGGAGGTYAGGAGAAGIIIVDEIY